MVLATIAEPNLTQRAVRHALAAAEGRAQLAAQGKDSILAYAASLEAARLTELLGVLMPTAA